MDHMSILRHENPELGERLDAFNASVIALDLTNDQKAHILNMNTALLLEYGSTIRRVYTEAIDAAFKQVGKDE